MAAPEPAAEPASEPPPCRVLATNEQVAKRKNEERWDLWGYVARAQHLLGKLAGWLGQHPLLYALFLLILAAEPRTARLIAKMMSATVRLASQTVTVVVR